jgi:uncharacterized protein
MPYHVHTMPDRRIVFAFDRKTARSFDADGRMRVRDCILSTAEVNPYYGREIPDPDDKLKLSPEKVYELYRSPEELKKSIPTFNGVPLMIKHIAQTASDPRKEYQAGSVHSVTFDGEHLRGDLLVSDGRAIELIESDELSDLSCGYRYDPVMQSGEADGSKYDGVMRNIQGNHVALVDDGRASGAHVADAAFVNPQTPDPSMQGDANMAFPEQKPTPPAAGAANAAEAAPGSPQGEQNEQANMAAIGQALKHIAELLSDIHGKVGGAAPQADTAGADHERGAMDSEHEEGEHAEDLELEPAAETIHINGGAEDSEHEEGEHGEDADLEEESGAARVEIPESRQEGTPARGNPTPHGAMDAKSVRGAIDRAVKAERARAAAVETARREVRPILGEVYGMDSAGAIYREALKTAGVDVSKVPKGAEQVAWQGFKAARGAAAGLVNGARVEMAMDSKAQDATRSTLAAHLDKISVKG